MSITSAHRAMASPGARTTTTISSHTALRLGLAWVALAFVMSANGVFRELVLRDLLGARWAPIASAILGTALLLLVTRALFPSLTAYRLRDLALVSGGLVLLTVIFETALGILVDHKSWRELLAHYDLARGELWPLVLLVLALTPFVWGRWLPPGARG